MNAIVKYVKFTLPEGHKDRDALIQNKYQFKDGELHVNYDDGQLVKPILEGYHGCKYEEVELTPKQAEASGEGGDLSAENTRGAILTSQPDNGLNTGANGGQKDANGNVGTGAPDSDNAAAKTAPEGGKPGDATAPEAGTKAGTAAAPETATGNKPATTEAKK